MFDHEQWTRVEVAIRDATERNFEKFTTAIDEVRGIAAERLKLRPRYRRSIAVVAADGGHNRIEAVSFLPLGAVRVVDDKGKVLFFEVIGPEDDMATLDNRHYSGDASTGHQPTALGRMMRDLEQESGRTIRTLHALSPMIPEKPTSPSWMLVYRDLCEWAAIYDLICNHHHADDTLFLRDGLLRSKIFREGLFVTLGTVIKKRIEHVRKVDKRDLLLVGIAKKTEVLTRYQIALELIDAFPEGDPWCTRVGTKLQRAVYRWPEYIRLLDDAPFDELLDEDFSDFTEEAKYNLGDMYFVRFGRFRSDPVWTIDLLSFQSSRAREILECLLGDTVKSYPIPCYPQALIDADAAAQVSGLDRDLLHQEAIKAIRSRLTRPQQQVLDAIPFAQDFAARRYK